MSANRNLVGAARRGPESVRWLAPVLAVTAASVFLTLVGLSLSGSSIGVFRNGAPDDALLVGAPLPIRSDEWIVMTPFSIGGDRIGLPSMRQVGLTETDMAVAPMGGPSRSWVTAFKPQDWGYMLLDAGRGLAWRWWASYLLCSLAFFGLLRALRVAPWAALGLAAAAAFSPYTAWWTSPATALILGWAAGAAMSAIRAMQSSRRSAIVSWSVLAAYCLVALALLLYPPWIVSTALVVAALVVGQAVDLRPGWRRLFAIGAIVGAVAGGVLALWYRHSADAIEATTDTIYPGQRRTEPGAGSVARFLSAPLNPWIKSGENVPGDSTSLPDLSSTWMPAGVIIVAVAVGLAVALKPALFRSTSTIEPCRDVRALPRATLTSLLVVLCLLAAWAFLPVPAVVGELTLLDRVQPWRLPLAIGFVMILLFGLASVVLSPTKTSGWRWPVAVLAVLATATSTVYASNGIPRKIDASLVEVATSACLLGAACIAVVLAGRNWFAGFLLGLYCLASWATVNPLYRGLGALEDEPIVAALSQRITQDQPVRTAVFEDGLSLANTQLAALVTSTGVDNLTATTFYPDRSLMEQLAPGQEEIWNNYLRYRWIDDDVPSPVITPTSVDFAELRIDPCSQEMALLDIALVISDHELPYDCLQLVESVLWRGAGREVFLYESSS